ncbi:MAG: ribonuclease H-like domain-containing protein [Clostridia bacterium]|nr:ribonuclease H-like domain-containing protein [Clostridia bacterium]
MHTIKTKQEFVEDIRSIDETLSKIRLSEVIVSRKEASIKYVFICDKTVDGELVEKIKDEAEKISPPVFRYVDVTINKIVSHKELVNKEIYKYLKSHFPSISIFLNEEDVSSEVVGDFVKYTLRLTADGAEYVAKNKTLLKLNDYLSTKFCSDFAGSVETKEVYEKIDLTDDTVFADQIEIAERRTIKVKDVVVIDDFGLGDTAYYIEDSQEGNITVCGTITEISEKTTKTGKPFFIIHINDTTGQMSGLYFSKKNTYDKIKELKEGDAIIVRATVGEYKGQTSIQINKINKCTFPTDFIKKDKAGAKVPKEYKTVFPKTAETVKVESVFEEKTELPKELIEKEYVVFDIETTGLDSFNDKITEIGAVKIKDGKITEEFSSLINPHVPIPERIVSLTGISDEMVLTAPDIKDVIADFMKFTDKTVLVAQNGLDFDIKFIKRFAKESNFVVNNPLIDTMILSRQVLPELKRNDLHTLAERFGIVFRHHRALSDAYATAEVFIELIKIKDKLNKKI